MMRFEELQIEEGTLDAIAAMGYENATPIQAQCLGPLLSGRDVVGQARTGSGKTAAFGIPMIDAIRAERDHIRGLVLVPTRELAIQVTEVLSDLAKGSKLEIVAIYGGAGFGGQLAALRRHGCKVIVATPGRLLDHVGRGTINLGKVSMLVLDEADRMLDMGFVPDMRRVLKLVPENRQTALFSATLPRDVLRLVSEFTSDAVRIHVDGGEVTPDAKQYIAMVEKAQKQTALLQLLHTETPERALVFTRTKHLAKRLARNLDGQGWASVALQGNMTQGQRERAMTTFRNGKARILVATDVAARGLDVHGITHVVNYDLPDADSYVHRIGRTARNGATGRAFTFVQSDQRQDLRAIKRVSGAISEVELVTTGQAPRGPDEQTEFAQRGDPPRHGAYRPSGQGGRPRQGAGRTGHYARRSGGRRSGGSHSGSGSSSRTPGSGGPRASRSGASSGGRSQGPRSGGRSARPIQGSR